MRLVNGILCPPSNPHEWTDDGVTWITHNVGCEAVKEEYWSGIFLAHLLNPLRARILAKHIRRSRFRKQIIAAHSNGAAIAIEAIKQVPDAHIDRLVLIAGAVSADCERNGLVSLLGNDRVGELVILYSPKDQALQYADTFGWCQHPLGLHGPKNLGWFANSHAVEAINSGLDHSGYFDRVHFQQTMYTICKEAA